MAGARGSERTELERTELEAVLETRREFGASYDEALVESFADRIEAAVLARTAQETSLRIRESRERSSAGPRQLALGIVSAGAGTGITAICLGTTDGGVTGLAAMLIGWAGLVSINLAHAFQSRPRG